jgi:MraZ protein
LAFRGTFDYTLDAKNRLTIPAKFRAQLADGVVLAKDTDQPCMAVWTPGDYDAHIERSLAAWHPLSQDHQNMRRFLNMNSFDTELDSAGRVMVPDFLREHAKLTKQAVVTGAGDRLEVWDRETFEAFNAQLTSTVKDITASLGHPA